LYLLKINQVYTIDQVLEFQRKRDPLVEPVLNNEEHADRCNFGIALVNYGLVTTLNTIRDRPNVAYVDFGINRYVLMEALCESEGFNGIVAACKNAGWETLWTPYQLLLYIKPEEA